MRTTTHAPREAAGPSVPRPVPRVVAHLLPWPGVGGVEQATLRIAQAARARGVRNVMLVRADADHVHDFVTDHGFAAVRFAPVQLSGRRPAAYLRNMRAIAGALQHQGAELLHCADVMGGFYGALAGRLARLPVICHVRNPFPDLSRRERALLLPVEHFVFVSADTWRAFAPRVPAHRGRVLYDGLPVRARAASGAAVRAELGIAATAPLIGMVARLSPQKDYETLGHAAVRVLQRVPTARFVVVGDVAMEPAHRAHYALVEQQLAALGVREAFAFTGFRSDVERLMSAFDLFVLSTHFEGLPLAVLEAMALGLPTVATAVNGIPELIPSPDVGTLVPPRDPIALAGAVLAMLADPAAAARRGAAAQAFVRTRFSQDAFAQGIAALYADLLGARR